VWWSAGSGGRGRRGEKVKWGGGTTGFPALDVFSRKAGNSKATVRFWTSTSLLWAPLVLSVAVRVRELLPGVGI